jgi:hypothetical protein
LIFFNLLIFLLLFDNDVLNFTDLKLRPWYFIITTLFILKFFKLMYLNPLTNINFKFNLNFIAWFYFVYSSSIFLIIDDFEAKLFNLKYWFFSIGLIYSLHYFFKKSNIEIGDAIKFWYFSILFSTIWGLIQFFGNIYGFAGVQLQHDWFNISPSGFFSERTWYGQYAAIGIILSFYYFILTSRKIYLFLFILCCIGSIVSASRSALIPLASSIFVYLLAFFAISKNFIYKFKILGYSTLLFLLITFINIGNDLNIFSLINKFTSDKIGIDGRFEVFNMLLLNLQSNPFNYIFGHGFEWDESNTSSIGTASGAKASNIFLMIFHIFGIVGLILSLLFFLKNFVLYLKKINNNPSTIPVLGLILYISFWGLSLVVPAHQYPSSLIILFFSLLILKIRF